MVSGGGKETREERLAARLRDNLRRRKQQARAQGGDAASGVEAQAGGSAEGKDPPLPKPPTPG